MLIEQQVFNLNEVGEKSLNDITNECLCHFAYDLKHLLEADDGNCTWGTWNYKFFQDTYGSKIKYNSKNVVYEETLYNNEPWSVKDTCKVCYGLEWVEDCEYSGYYRFKDPDPTVPKMVHPKVCTERVNPTNRGCLALKGDIIDKNICKFNEYFGKGEFPFMTITIIRLGNKDHYFYTIHR